ncbi:MAG: hypothetical protein AAGA18_09400 [Verrucomicrobiota bacterium]
MTNQEHLFGTYCQKIIKSKKILIPLLAFYFWTLLPLFAEFEPFSQRDSLNPPYATEEELLEKFPTLDQVSQREITYLYAKLNKTRLANHLGEEILRKHPLDRDTLIVLVSMYQANQDGPMTEKYARKLLEIEKEDPEGLYYLGFAMLLQRHYAEAEKIYLKMQAKYKNPADFPHKADLARASHRAGSWQNAISVYRKMLLDPSVQGELRHDARIALEELYVRHLPHLRARAEYFSLTQGKILREEVTYKQHVTLNHRMSIDIRRDDIWQDGDTLVQTRDEGRTQALAGVEIRHHPQFFSTYKLGGGESATGSNNQHSRLIASFELRHLLEPEREKYVYLGFHYNDRATDSINLELLDGRQNQIALGTLYQINRDTVARAELNLRQLTLGDGFEEKLYGESVGFEWAIDRSIFNEPVQVILTYSGEYMALARSTSDFTLVDPIFKDNADLSLRQDVLDGLVDSEIHRHQFTTTMISDITNQWSFEVSSNVGYSLPADENPFYGFRSATTYYFTKSISLRLEAGYSSDASSSNAGAESQDVALELNAFF